MGSQQRPWYRLRNIILGVFALFFVFISWVGIEIWRLSAMQPVVAVNHREQFNRLSAQAAQLPANYDGRDAWQSFLDVIELGADIERAFAEDSTSRTFEPRDDVDTGHVNFARIVLGRTLPDNFDRERRTLLAMHEQEVFEKLRQLRSMPLALKPPDADETFIAEHLPELGKSRRFAEMLAAAMRISASDGDLNTSIEHFSSMLFIAHTISHQYSIIATLVSRSIEVKALGQLWHLLMEYQLTGDQLSQIAELLNRYKMTPMQLSLQGEQLLFRDFVQRTYSDDGSGDGYLLPHAVQGINSVTGDFPDILSLAAARFYFGRRAETEAIYDSFFTQTIAESRKPARDRWQAFDESTIELLPKKHLMVKLMMPALRKAIDHEDAIAVMRTGTRLMLALAAHHAKYGNYPSDLQLLAPEFLETLPVDPLHGGPFGYRLLQDDPNGRPYLLYGFGLNGIDDGGAEADLKTQSSALTDPRIEGVDFILNRPRPTE